MRKTLIGALALGMLVAWLGAVAGPSAAAGAVASWSERQVVPGLTERTIWGRDQVYVYRLPSNVTHLGDLHVELTYTPADGDCFIYLLGPVAKGSSEWQVCPGTYGQGFLSLSPGREVVDYAVPAVLDQDPVDDGVRGDTYYVVVQAANATSRFRLSGYLPRTSAGSTDTTSEATFTRFSFRTPASARASIAVAGAPYGGPFDLTPTSQGEVECRLQYPADPGKRTVEPASPALKASFEQYVYPPLWEPEGDGIPVEPADGSVALGPLRPEPARGRAAGRRRLVRPAGRLRGAGRRPVGPAPDVPLRARPLARRRAAVRRGAGSAGTAGDRPADRRLQGHAADPAEPAARVRHAQGAQRPRGEAQGIARRACGRHSRRLASPGPRRARSSRCSGSPARGGSRPRS